MEALFLTKKDVKLVGAALNALQVDLMKRLNETYSSSYMFADPEKVREEIYSQMDATEVMFDRIGYWSLDD